MHLPHVSLFSIIFSFYSFQSLEMDPIAHKTVFQTDSSLRSLVSLGSPSNTAAFISVFIIYIPSDFRH